MSDFEFSKGFGDGLYNEALGAAYRYAKVLQPRCQSPIEIQFGAAFMFITRLIDFPAELITTIADTYPGHVILPQAQIGPYRVDFYVAFREVSAVIECDGREFHYANREQIERDRARDKALEELGFKVFRFPGAQLHSEPMRCSGDVLIWLLRQWGDKHPGEKF